MLISYVFIFYRKHSKNDQALERSIQNTKSSTHNKYTDEHHHNQGVSATTGTENNSENNNQNQK